MALAPRLAPPRADVPPRLTHIVGPASARTLDLAAKRWFMVLYTPSSTESGELYIRLIMTRAPKYLAEAIGTFCLVFAGTGAIAVRQLTAGQVSGLEVCLVFGLVATAMVYAVGHISGAHLNPAVTLAFYSSGRLGREEIAPYCAAQVLGATAASALVTVLFGREAVLLGATLPSAGWAQAFVMELVLTAILVFVVMAVATDHRAQGTMAGVAIGAVVCLGAIIGGPVSGASMNPARSLGPALLGLEFGSHWLYWAAPILGGFVGARAYALLQCEAPGGGPGKGCC